MTGNQLLSSAAACQCSVCRCQKRWLILLRFFARKSYRLEIGSAHCLNELRVAFLGRQTFERGSVIIAKPQPRQGHFVAGQVQIVHLLRSFAANRARHFSCVHALHFHCRLSRAPFALECMAGASGAEDAAFPALGTASPRDFLPGRVNPISQKLLRPERIGTRDFPRCLERATSKN
jgi:hypothetical protein